MPKLDDWIWFNGSLIGHVYEDAKKMFEDGERIITSAVELLDVTHGYCLTKNTRYDLGTMSQSSLTMLAKGEGE